MKQDRNSKECQETNLGAMTVNKGEPFLDWGGTSEEVRLHLEPKGSKGQGRYYRR